MRIEQARKRRLAVICLAGLLLAGPVLAGKKKEPPPGDGLSRIEGKVRTADSKAATGATVHAYHLSTGRLYSSSATGSGGSYRIEGLPFGYFELAVETADGLFVGNQVVNVGPASRAIVLMTLAPYAAQPQSWWSSNERRPFSGSEAETSGLAEVQRRLSRREFLRSTKGVVVLSTVGAAALLVIAASDDSETFASPIQ